MFKKTTKRGQITLFAILGIVLLTGLSWIIYMKKSATESTAETIISSKKQAGASAVKPYIESCLKQVSEKLILEIAEKGGSFEPRSGIYFNGRELNSLAEYQSGFGYNNQMLLVSEMENELSLKIEQELRDCIDMDIFKDQGYEIEERVMSVKTSIGFNDIRVSLDYPLKLTRADISYNFERFSSGTSLPLRELYTVAVDIVNSEAAFGFFDKEEFMLKQGGKIKIEKFREYPNTIYVLKQSGDGVNKEMVLQFAIKGEDTAGKEVLFYNKKGCCRDVKHNIYFKNVESSQCLTPNQYDSSPDCQLVKNSKPSAEGCCNIEDICELTARKECTMKGGSFYMGDFRCSSANCNNLHCPSTYDYVTNDFSRPLKKHGASWCSYDSMVGGGRDYVGTRHYLHSCINGAEYVEPCRDYREELCTEEVIAESGRNYQKAGCRTNRWYDCSIQDNREDCEDKTLRDCSWADYLWSQKKCHPLVSPGLKFWEPSYGGVCNTASLDRNDYARENPGSWGHSALLYCQRTGDCGNYRNIADDLTTLGYYNRDGTPEEWAYWDEGYTKRGNDFVVRAELDETGVSSLSSIPEGIDGRYAGCSLWEAPATNRCDLCSSLNPKFRPCTEYKCRSLGKNCVFDESDKSCSISGSSDVIGPVITLKDVEEGYSYASELSQYYDNTIEYKISPNVPLYTEFKLGFSSSEPSRCRISLAPPGISPDNAGFITEILLNEFKYKEDYDITLRFPSSELTHQNQYMLFIRCYDASGNYNEQGAVMEIFTEYPLDDLSPPKIIGVLPKPEDREDIVFDSPNDFSLFVNEPFDSCRYSASETAYADMAELGCSSEISDVVYDANSPLGSYVCSGSVNVAAGTDKLFFACKDKKGNVNELVVYSLP